MQDGPIEAMKLPQNRARYVPPKLSRDIGSRETTPLFDGEELDGEEGGGLSRHDTAHRILLTFDKPPSDIAAGFSFGTGKNCDVLLGAKSRSNNISRIQFYITYDMNRCLVLIAHSISRGTAVSYNGWGEKITRLRGFKWILSRGKVLSVHLPNYSLGLLLPTYETCQTADYQENVTAYLKNSYDAVPRFDQLATESLDRTAFSTNPLSPRQHPIYVPSEELGEGTFGRVFRVTDVSTAHEYAAKVFKDNTFEVDIVMACVHVGL